MSTDNSYQTYLKDCDCENGGIILHEGEAVCRWCRKPYGKGGKMYYEPNHFKASKQPKQERIEVLSMAIKKQWGDGKIDFECQLSYGISKYLFPAIKQAIESVLNNDTVVEDDLSGVEKHFTEKRYTQSEVDTIRRETWEQCRKFIDGHYFYHEGFKYPTLSDYLSSLNSKDTGKKKMSKNQIGEMIEGFYKEEQPTNDNAFVWDESLVGELTEWASSNDWTYLPSKNKWFNEEDEINITPITTEQLINKFKQSKQSAPPIVIDEDAFKNRCNVCGDDLVYIRGKYPNTDKRPTCPTCTTERLEQINEISNKDYGKAYQNKS